MMNKENVLEKLARDEPSKQQELIEKLRHENLELSNKLSQIEILLEAARQKVSWFEEQVKLARQRRFGKSSEKSSAIQPDLFNALGDDAASEEPEECKADATTTATITYTRPKKEKNGRNIDTSLLPRKKIIHDLADHEKTCADCGGQLHKVCENVSEQLEVIPKQLYVVEHICPQYACRPCETMHCAKKTEAPIAKCMAGASLITDVVVNKYEYHLPLYRQSTILKGLGSDIPDNTLGNWVMRSGEVLEPVGMALQQEIKQMSYLQVDETPVKVLESDKKGYMWCYLSPLPGQKLIQFRFHLSRGGEVVNTELQDFTGRLQNDGYGGYTKLREKPTISAFGCLSHARRKFAEIVKIATPKSASKAQEALKYFAKLYDVEAQAREEKLPANERRRLRQEKSWPVLNKFYEWLTQTKQQVPPKSKIGMAIDYTLKHWPYLTQYVDDGAVEADTNWVENQIRPFAVGRRNWFFVGHEQSGQIGALFYSLIQSAKLNDINPRIYLHYLLTQVHALRRKEIDPRDLLPHRISREVLSQFAEQEFNKVKSLFGNVTTPA